MDNDEVNRLIERQDEYFSYLYDQTQEFVCPTCGELVKVLNGIIVKDCKCNLIG